MVRLARGVLWPACSATVQTDGLPARLHATSSLKDAVGEINAYPGYGHFLSVRRSCSHGLAFESADSISAYSTNANQACDRSKDPQACVCQAWLVRKPH